MIPQRITFIIVTLSLLVAFTLHGCGSKDDSCDLGLADSREVRFRRSNGGLRLAEYRCGSGEAWHQSNPTATLIDYGQKCSDLEPAKASIDILVMGMCQIQETFPGLYQGIGPAPRRSRAQRQLRAK
ncbi:Charged multivesicular body protein 6 [Perkinsus olseni]|uniref:Charged multivesicular body protein 6 n=1 Tax=Perkinsus olseni TaxID=32597 RepID=A0A7J6PNJ7_PEROL|nr:Charged multivesicular body protein 6 [Perkinsus olseni]KAF4698262.1 Charged multivesicular body protein 6 [Perkinsus olseni]KAF4737820.1 Charged multivesicular body protein 6 [Perkinsus olseni]